jgi:hypothetical protein
MTENYSFTRKKIREDRRELVRARVLALLFYAAPVALGSLIHVGWAVAGVFVGFALNVIYFRR